EAVDYRDADFPADNAAATHCVRSAGLVGALHCPAGGYDVFTGQKPGNDGLSDYECQLFNEFLFDGWPPNLFAVGNANGRTHQHAASGHSRAHEDAQTNVNDSPVHGDSDSACFAHDDADHGNADSDGNSYSNGHGNGNGNGRNRHTNQHRYRDDYANSQRDAHTGHGDTYGTAHPIGYVHTNSDQYGGSHAHRYAAAHVHEYGRTHSNRYGRAHTNKHPHCHTHAINKKSAAECIRRPISKQLIYHRN
ncbi:MAG: hypothetical protein P8183_23200, partial [Anaerolineae bacterium]